MPIAICLKNFPSCRQPIRGRPGFVAMLEQRPLLLFEPGDGRCLFLGIFLPLQIDLLERFLDLCDPDRDLLLFLLQFFQRHDFVPHFGESGRFRGPFAAEGDLRFLQVTFLAPEGEACPLPTHF